MIQECACRTPATHEILIWHIKVCSDLWINILLHCSHQYIMSSRSRMSFPVSGNGTGYKMNRQWLLRIVDSFLFVICYTIHFFTICYLLLCVCVLLFVCFCLFFVIAWHSPGSVCAGRYWCLCDYIPCTVSLNLTILSPLVIKYAAPYPNWYLLPLLCFFKKLTVSFSRLQFVWNNNI